MTADKPSPITPPPSVVDVLTSLVDHESRIGRVDFSTRLASEPPAPPAPVEEPAEKPAETRATEPAADEDAAEPAQENESARVTEDIARLAPHDVLVDAESDPDLAETLSMAQLESQSESQSESLGEPVRRYTPADEAQPTPGPTTGPTRGPAPEPPAVRIVTEHVDLEVVEVVEVQAPPRPARAPSPARQPTHQPAGQLPGSVAHANPRDAVRSVASVADSAVMRMRQAETATLHHLEALEAEAQRRCDLITAQAELDAELIRLHARREAHAIITAARMRAGEHPHDEDGSALSRIGDALADVAESTETTFAPAPRSPDHFENP